MKKINLGIWVFLGWLSFAFFPEVLIITNPDTGISSLEKKDVKDIFTGKRTRWNDSGKITIVTLDDSDVHREFVRQFLDKTPIQFKNYWRQKVFTGEGMLPKTFKDEDSLIDFITKTKGAIGYISTPTKKPVKVISIEGSHGEHR